MFLRHILETLLMLVTNPPPKSIGNTPPKKSFPRLYDIVLQAGKETSIHIRNPLSFLSEEPPAKPDATKPKREAIPSSIRNEVWNKYHGNSIRGRCYCCNVALNRYNNGWHCSHVVASNKGGKDEVDNLRVCCKHCNLSMGNQNLYVYMQDKGLTGPGSKNVASYLRRNPTQKLDKRTNNWGKTNSTSGPPLMTYAPKRSKGLRETTIIKVTPPLITVNVPPTRYHRKK